MMPVGRFSPDQELTWEHVPRGGYGYVVPVHVAVVRQTGKRVLVRAPLRSGGTREVWVRPEHLRERGK